MSAIHIGIIDNMEEYIKNECSDQFSEYENALRKYHCIGIDDEELLPFINRSYDIKLPVSYVEPTNEGTKIDWCGITLVSPDSVRESVKILEEFKCEPWYSSLYEQCRKALEQNKYMIYYGV